MSWLDTNANGKEDIEETHGPFTVYAIEQYGKGEIVLFSGPSLLINSMENQLDNKIFKDNLLQYLFNNRDVVIIDESHREVFIPFQIGYLFPSELDLSLKISIVILTVFVFLILFTSIPKDLFTIILDQFNRLRSINKSIEKKNPINIVEDILEKHPTWNRVKLENIIMRIENNE
jgi:hypothetical protein